MKSATDFLKLVSLDAPLFPSITLQCVCIYQGCGANYTGAAPVRTKPGAPKKFLVRCGAAPVQCLLYTLRCGAAPVKCLFV